MKKFFLIVLGISAAISLLFPPAIIIGLFLGIVPGILLLFALTAFTYFTAACLLGAALKFLRIPLPTLVSLVLVLSIGCLTSFILNKPIVQKVDEYAALDMPLENEFVIPKVMALYSKYYMRHGSACNAICQGLLYNKVSDKVLILTDPSIIKNNINQSVTSYQITKQENCTNEHTTSKRWGNLAGVNVQSRITAGECLEKSSTKLSEADVIFFNSKINLNDGYSDYKSFSRRVVFVNFIQLLKNTGNSFEKIYRYSEIKAQPFAYPLSFGWILGASGGNMSLDFGFFHSSMSVNNPGPSYGTPIKEFEQQMKQILGPALEPIQPADVNTAQLIKDALESDGPKIAAHSLVGNYLREICSKKITPSAGDMDLIINALEDDRVDNWNCLNGFSQQWYKEHQSLPYEFLEALVDRILRRKDVYEASQTIRFLPDRQAEVIYSKIKQIALDEQLREDAYGVVLRLSDGGEKAIPIFIDILNEYNAALNNSNRNARINKLQNMRNSPTAALIGLCRLGSASLPAKDILFNLVNEESPRFTISKLAVDALIEMSLTAELEKKYKSNEKLWKEIQSAIGKKERAENKGQEFCGKRIM